MREVHPTCLYILLRQSRTAHHTMIITLPYVYPFVQLQIG